MRIDAMRTDTMRAGAMFSDAEAKKGWVYE